MTHSEASAAGLCSRCCACPGKSNILSDIVRCQSLIINASQGYCPFAKVLSESSPLLSSPFPGKKNKELLKLEGGGRKWVKRKKADVNNEQSLC